MKKHNSDLLIVGPLLPPLGGVTRWTADFLELLKSTSIIYSIFVSNKSYKIQNKKLFLPIYFTIFILDFIVNISNNKPNLIHIVTSASYFGSIRDLIITKISKIFSIKVLLHYHCNIQQQIKGLLHEKIIIKAMIHSNKVIVLNSDSLNYVKKVKILNANIIPNFTLFGSDIYGKRNLNSTIEKVLFVGHLLVEKGVKKINELSIFFPEIQFVLVGKNIDFSNFEFNDNVKVVGEIQNRNILKHYFSICDAMIFPSYSEGFPLAVLEAMKFQLPIMLSDKTFHRDIIDNRGAVFFNPDKIQDIIKALTNLMNLDRRERLISYNINLYNKEFSRLRVLNKWESIYTELILGEKK